MSKLDKKAYASPHGRVGVFAKTIHALLLILLTGGLFLVVPVFAQSIGTSGTRAGSISGTVVDANNQPVADAIVILQGPLAGDRLTLVTKRDGVFAFRELTPRTPYQITVAAEGFADWSSFVTVGPGESKTLANVKLRIQAVHRSVTVGYSAKETAAQQLKAQEQQRILGFIPNMYVVYDPHPEPLTSKMKFELAYKDLTHPVFFARTALWAGVQQAADSPSYGSGAEGYAKRFGAGIADNVIEGMVGNAILPSLLHQDPRYFYQGNGTTKSRLLHAILAPFITKADNGTSQPNYSTWGGVLAASSISNTYYPDPDRGAAHVFKDFGIGMGLHVVGSLAQEFILDKFTSKGTHTKHKDASAD